MLPVSLTCSTNHLETFREALILYIQIEFSTHFAFKIAQLWKKLVVTMVASLHNGKFSNVLFSLHGFWLIAGGEFLQPQSMLRSTRKNQACIRPTAERLRPRIRLAMQGTSKVAGPLHISCVSSVKSQ